MSVAKSQLVEVLRIIERHAPGKVAILLQELSDTEAYRRNKSYRETIDRLYAQQLKGWQ